MATTTYNCTVCKRQVERVENVYGLDIFAKCIITRGCRGKLRKTGRNMDNIRESFPKFEANLEDYAPRNSFAQHKQTIESASWTVDHGLNCDPAITVYTANASGKLVPLDNALFTATPIDRNSTKIVFPIATSGIAHFNARSSTGIVNAGAVETSELTQVTVGGSFVFAMPRLITKDTRSGDSVTMDLNDPIGDIRLEIVLEKPNQEPIYCFEIINGMLDSTPWTGISEVLVAKRKNYYLKTKNILNFNTFSNPELKFTDIPEGTRLRFTRVDYGTGVTQHIEYKSVLMLLSAAPYEFTDKIRNKLLDLGELLTVGGYLTYSNGEFYVNTSVIEKTYPPIEVARRVTLVPPIPSPTPTPTPSPTTPPCWQNLYSTEPRLAHAYDDNMEIDYGPVLGAAAVVANPYGGYNRTFYQIPLPNGTFGMNAQSEFVGTNIKDQLSTGPYGPIYALMAELPPSALGRQIRINIQELIHGAPLGSGVEASVGIAQIVRRPNDGSTTNIIGNESLSTAVLQIIESTTITVNTAAGAVTGVTPNQIGFTVPTSINETFFTNATNYSIAPYNKLFIYLSFRNFNYSVAGPGER